MGIVHMHGPQIFRTNIDKEISQDVFWEKYFRI